MKKIRRLLIGIIAMTLLFGVSALAEGTESRTETAASKITITAPNKSKVVYVGETGDKVQFKVTYQTANKKGQDMFKPAGVTVRSSDRNILAIEKIEKDSTNPNGSVVGNNYVVTETVTVRPESNGTVTLTVKDKFPLSKKKATIKVTVKTYAENIEVASAKPVDGKQVVYVSTGGKLQLGAAVTNSDASDKKLTYSSEDTSVAKVDKKGVVTLNAKATAGKEAAINITSNDKKASCKVTVKVSDPIVKSVALKEDTTDKKPADGQLAKKGKAFTLNLKGNRTSAGTYMYDLSKRLKINDSESFNLDDVCFESANPKVASVSDKGNDKGMIVANGNGKTTITVSSKRNSKISAKLTVNVNTLVTTVNIRARDNKVSLLANNKDSITFIGTTNGDATNKGVKYSIVRVNNLTDKKDIKKYASISSKGVLKAKEPCGEIVVQASAAEKDSKISSTMTVKAVTYVNSMAIVPDVHDEGVVFAKNNKSGTVYRADSGYTQLKLRANLDMKNKEGENDHDISWSTSNKKVAEVEFSEDNKTIGEIVPKGNGSAKITAKDKRSGKSATFSVTVKTDVYRIQVPKAVTDTATAKPTVYVIDTRKHEVDLAKAIGAVVNNDASAKGLTYKTQNDKDEWVTTKKMTREKGSPAFAVKIVPATAPVAKKSEVSQVVMVQVIDSTDAATEYKFKKKPSQPYPVFAGSTTAFDPSECELVASDGKLSVDDLSKITWKSKDTKVAKVDKNGVVTGVKAGKTTITASFKRAKEDQVFDVIVGRSQKQVTDEFNNAFADELNAENRDYLGVSMKFNKKNNAIEISVLKPDKPLEGLKGIGAGLADSVKAVIGPNLQGVNIKAPDGVWKAVRNGVTLTVTEPSGITKSNMSETEAIQYIMEKSAQGKQKLRDWVGSEYEIEIVFDEGIADLVYTAKYDATVLLPDAAHDKMTDEAINTAVARLNDLNIAGIKSVTYVNATKTFAVIADDGKQEIAKTDADYRESVVNILRDPLMDVKQVTISAQLPLKDETKGTIRETVTHTPGNNDIDDSLNALLNRYLGKLRDFEITTYKQLDGSSVNILVTYQYGTITKEVVYTMTVSVLEDIDAVEIDKVADEKIADAIAAAGGDYAYDAETNTVTVKVAATVKNGPVTSLVTAELDDILDAMVKAAGVNTERSITVALGDTTAELKADQTTLDMFMTITNKLGVVNVEDLLGKTITLKVPYGSNVELSYKMEFKEQDSKAASVEEDMTVDVSGNDAVEDVSEEEIVEDIPADGTDEDVPEEEAVEDTPTDDDVEETSVEDVTAENPVEEIPVDEDAVEIIAEQ